MLLQVENKCQLGASTMSGTSYYAVGCSTFPGDLLWMLLERAHAFAAPSYQTAFAHTVTASALIHPGMHEYARKSPDLQSPFQDLDGEETCATDV